MAATSSGQSPILKRGHDPWGRAGSAVGNWGAGPRLEGDGKSLDRAEGPCRERPGISGSPAPLGPAAWGPLLALPPPAEGVALKA